MDHTYGCLVDIAERRVQKRTSTIQPPILYLVVILEQSQREKQRKDYMAQGTNLADGLDA